MNVISDILYWISTGLLVPVIVLLILFFVRALMLVGGFFGQYLQEKRLSAGLGSRIAGLTPERLPEFGRTLPEKADTLFTLYVKKILAEGARPARAELLIAEYEIAADKSIALPRTLAKIGPMLGLMGTLIPMGPALVGLSAGDIASMAYNMQVAFATTVVGLVISAIGLFTQQVRERWAHRNLTLLEYLADLVGQTPDTSL